ncbi:MAG: EamA family transporter [Acidobacteriia bacterium]|nr:EamA family transporter [Terriglobia bacterium]
MNEGSPQQLQARPPAWQIILAFAIIYLVWGSTYLAIRVGVREMPPFLMAGLRFLIAGFALYWWMRARGVPAPSRQQWLAAVFLSSLLFVLDYGCLFWAEVRVPSGIAAVVLATIPVFMTLFEIVLLRTQRFTARLGFAFLLGIFGVAVLINPSRSLGGVPIDRAGAIALLTAAVSWSFASILMRKLPLPASKPMSAAAQMFSGGALLMVLSAVTGEFRGFHFGAMSFGAWFSLFYLIVAGSIIGYTAYLWLLHFESPTRVGTYAYVNPIVAVILGYMLGRESIGIRTIAATVLILVSVVVITTTRAKPITAET